ncbi:MAG: 50S ribosomal protein L10 [Thaumarchaeota archaeon]|nr:50S ribosomal protein L10 [Nitrososphaerota archaeon]MDE0265858.1 50S ribosomal protein L10 [Nitrososphaerota archaeon]
MHENRTTYSPKKAQMYQQIQSLPKRYRVLALVKLDKVRGAQILPLRKTLKDDVLFVNIKDRVAKKALRGLDIPGIAGIAKELVGQCMLMFTDMSPFRLNMLLGKNKIMMAARGGDTSSMDVVVPEMNTGIAPGPMLTEFKEAGIPTKIDQGTIWISKDTTPVHKGEVINDKLASILGKLDIKPVEAGISLYAALEDGLVYAEDDLTIDVEAFRDSVIAAHQEALSLSVEAAYVTPENVTQILAKASQHARSLSVESGYLTDETREQVLQRADARARALAQSAEGYEPQ